jgi:hypothetical protein
VKIRYAAIAAFLFASSANADDKMYVGEVYVQTPVGMIRSKTFAGTEKGVTYDECQNVIRDWGDGHVTDADLTVEGVVYETFSTRCEEVTKVQ